MKHVLIVLAALCLTACNTTSLLAPSPKLTPEAQKIQAEARADFDRALAKRLETCQITATGDIGFELSATPKAGTQLNGSVNCQPRPWSLNAP